MEIIKSENELIKRIEELRKDIEAIQQPRSDFAIKNFVVGQHDMPGRQRQQAVLELQIKMFNIRRAQLEEKRMKIQRQRFMETGDELDKVEAEKIEVDLAELRLSRMGAIREANALLKILDTLPEYTYEQLQQEEAEYWQRRLSRQALQDLRSMGTISAGNLEAIGQMIGEKAHLDIETIKALAKISEQ